MRKNLIFGVLSGFSPAVEFKWVQFFDVGTQNKMGIQDQVKSLELNTSNLVSVGVPTTLQGQKFVAVLKAKSRGAATSQNVKNRGIVAAKIVKIAAMSRQKS